MSCARRPCSVTCAGMVDAAGPASSVTPPAGPIASAARQRAVQRAPRRIGEECAQRARGDRGVVRGDARHDAQRAEHQQTPVDVVDAGTIHGVGGLEAMAERAELRGQQLTVVGPEVAALPPVDAAGRAQFDGRGDDGIQEGVEGGSRLVGRLQRKRGGIVGVFDEPVRDREGRADEQCVLVREVAVQRGSRDADGGGDVLHPDRVIPVLREGERGGLLDTALAVTRPCARSGGGHGGGHAHSVPAPSPRGPIGEARFTSRVPPHVIAVVDLFVRLSPYAVLGVMTGRDTDHDGRPYFFVLEQDEDRAVTQG